MIQTRSFNNGIKGLQKNLITVENVLCQGRTFVGCFIQLPFVPIVKNAMYFKFRLPFSPVLHSPSHPLSPKSFCIHGLSLIANGSD